MHKGHIITRHSVHKWLGYIICTMGLIVVVAYITLFCLIAIHAHASQRHLLQRAEAALILGYRTYQHAHINTCLTGRVDKGISLANQGVVSILMMSGGRDFENNAIEAEVMAAYAISKGFHGQIIQESYSTSTMENLKLSSPILKAASIKKIIIVSEPYHLWRVRKLATAINMPHDFDISYAAAASDCWTTWGMLSRGALREPLAIMHNAAKGYFYSFK